MTNTYTEDNSFDLYDPQAPAVFLPSISTNYLIYSSLYPSKMTDQRNPDKMSRDGKELNFLKEGNGNFYWPYALYSAGHADLRVASEVDQTISKESMLRTRDKSKTLIVGDSGGYQIGKGLLEFDWKNFDCEKNNKLRMEILRWLEATADLSMTLDAPTWGIGSEKCGLTSFQDCLDKTMFNHEFFIKNRVPGATRFLNILHGRNKEETDIWWDTVKDLPFEGWAFAGINMADFERILRRLIIMRDGGYLDKARNWIHFLGVSRMSSACAFSAIQRTLRKHVEPSLTISYDASSPFISTAKGRLYTRHTCNSKNIGFSLDKAFDNKDLAGSTLNFPVLSPIGRKLKVGDICVKGNDIDSKSSWDTYSYIYIMNHNVYMHMKAICEANNFYALPREQAQHNIPSNLLDFRELVEEVFTSEKPFELIEKNHRLLNNLSGMKMGNKKLSALDSSGLFSLEGESSNSDEYDDMFEEDYDDTGMEE